ncbi:Protein-associating with the carboxyl-terminal domain of ezrin [Trichoplax sp. H2]|nr:Protein-associating with the carboxyl-terminal domain of ezrin [Trichoplax sp. H2]|eukprot:RDD44380.1 Protein-associating with the carboxyl-terminal domain of ezrin [Trichoplax sp. H2]
MGAENSILDSYKLSEPLIKQKNNGQPWTIRPALNDKGIKVAVFTHDLSLGSSKPQNGIENATKQLKLLRHPFILKYYESYASQTEIALVTEYVKPLELVVDEFEPDEIIVGLYEIVQALSFLHDRGLTAHNNIAKSAIYVSQSDGCWKLGGMEYTRSYRNINAEFLRQTTKYRCSDAISPEEKSGKFDPSLSSSQSRDVYAFGRLVMSLKEKFEIENDEVVQRFTNRISEQCLIDDPKLRSKFGQLMKEEIFTENDLLDLVTFLNNITLKSNIEKQEFFRYLAKRLRRYRSATIVRRLLKMLLSRFALAEPFASVHFFPHLFAPRENHNHSKDFIDGKINPIITMDLFKEEVIPIIVKLFKVRHKHVRLLILDRFNTYINYFNKQQLQKEVLPKILQGLRDIDNEIVAATFRAMADCVLVLGAENVVGTADRRTIFKEGQPDFQKPLDRPLALSPQESFSSYEVSPSTNYHIIQKMIDNASITSDDTHDDPVEIMERSSTKNVFDTKLNYEKSMGDKTNSNIRGDSPEMKKKLDRERRREENRKRNEEKKRQRDLLKSGKKTGMEITGMEHAASVAGEDDHLPLETPQKIVNDIHNTTIDQKVDVISESASINENDGNRHVEEDAWSNDNWEYFGKPNETDECSTTSSPETTTMPESNEDYLKKVKTLQTEKSSLNDNMAEVRKNLSDSVTLSGNGVDNNSSRFSTMPNKDILLPNEIKATESRTSISSISEAVHDSAAGSTTGSVKTELVEPRNNQAENGWQTWNASQPSSPTLSTSSSNTSKNTPSLKKLKKTNKVETLGHEFDIQIKSVDPTEEIDFFADMLPVYTAPEKSVEIKSRHKQSSKSDSKSLFSIRDSTNDSGMGTSGWDDEWEDSEAKICEDSTQA